MRAMRLVIVTVAAVLALAGATAAQSTTGTISGRVVDAQGLAVPGVTVVASSPNLQGTRETVTSANGDYILSLLPSGAYTVNFTLSGFGPQARSVAVAPTQTVALEVELGPAALTETVEVVGRADVFTGTAQLASNFKQALMEALPTSRSLVASVLMAPNVRASGPGGTSGGDGSLVIAGAMAFDSLYMVNGVAVTENLRGQPFTLFIEDALQEVTVSTAGISAEFGRFGGGMVNAITKSGGNRFSGSFRNSFNNDSWRTTTPFNEPRLDKTIPTYEYTAGGPIVRDRLWFFTAGRLRKSEESRQTAVTTISYPRTDDEKRYEGKLTYSLAPGQTVRGTFMKIQQQIGNNNFQNAMDLRSLYNQKQPQDLLAVAYTGLVGSSLSVEGQYSRRNFSITDSGATETDLINGTLLIDLSRGGTAFRYWSPTFCACNDDERDNTDLSLKGTYFLSSNRLGAHTLVFGYDGFNDHRRTNNHQSGSDYRILGTSTVVRDGVIYPVFAASTLIQYNPISLESSGTDLKTHALFANDQWRMSDRVTFNLGLRWDRNQGEDAAGNTVSNSSNLSPRVGVVFDPAGDGRWSITGSFARYVSGLNSGIAEVSPAGNSANYQWAYAGPAINTDPNGALATPDVALRTLFDWFQANGGTSRTAVTAEVPGVNTRVGGTLKSPNSLEYAAGVGRAFGQRGSVRVDYVFRDFNDFYVTRTDLTTGRVSNSLGQVFDLNLIENSNDLERRYQGATFQGTLRPASSLELGATYTLSRTWGNFDGENPASGPLTAQLFSYPEYREASWNLPEGDLGSDQRHRARIWGVYRVPLPERAGSLDLGLMFSTATGTPYVWSGATSSAPGIGFGPINPRPYVTNPGYANPLGNTATVEYFFFPRDQYRLETQYRTDLSTNYQFTFPGGVQAFFRGEVLNLFDQFQLCGCGGTVFNNGGGSDIRTVNTGVLTASNNTTLRAFNPFTETPVQGTHWNLGPTFGRAVNRFAYTSPRTFRFSVGVRF